MCTISLSSARARDRVAIAIAIAIAISVCCWVRCLPDFSMQNGFCRTIDVIVGSEASSSLGSRTRCPHQPVHQPNAECWMLREQSHLRCHVFACSTAKFACLPDGDKLSAGSELMTLIIATVDGRQWGRRRRGRARRRRRSHGPRRQWWCAPMRNRRQWFRAIVAACVPKLELGMGMAMGLKQGTWSTRVLIGLISLGAYKL